MKKYGIMVILYNPDKNVFRNLKRYKETGWKIFVYDNTPAHCKRETTANMADISREAFKETSRETFKKNFKKTFKETETDTLEKNTKYISKGNVTYVSAGKNNGMSAALTAGFQWALKERLDYLLTMDQDSIFTKRDIRRMTAYIEADTGQDTAIYCPNYRKVYASETGAGICTRPKIKVTQVRDTDFGMTSGSFVNVKRIGQCLPLDDLFIGLVDNDICYTLRRKGCRIQMIGRAMLYQYIGEQTAGTWGNRIRHKIILSEKRYYYMGRNLTYLMKKYKDSRSIVRQLRRIRRRILLNLFLCEEQKSVRYQYWMKGVRESCPPFHNIG